LQLINSHHVRFTFPESHFNELQSTCQSGGGLITQDQTNPTVCQSAAPVIVDQPLFVPIQCAQIVSVYESILPSSVGFVKSSDGDTMPLAQHLKNGYLAGKPEAWHRSEERLTRWLPLHDDPNVPLEEWERELAWTEILLLSGSQCFNHWARAWGREDGFDAILTQLLARRSNVQPAVVAPSSQHVDVGRTAAAPTCASAPSRVATTWSSATHKPGDTLWIGSPFDEFDRENFEVVSLSTSSSSSRHEDSMAGGGQRGRQKNY
jgi:hypothetical protein